MPQHSSTPRFLNVHGRAILDRRIKITQWEKCNLLLKNGQKTGKVDIHMYKNEVKQ
jgi:hypothetical protein